MRGKATNGSNRQLSLLLCSVKSQFRNGHGRRTNTGLTNTPTNDNDTKSRSHPSQSGLKIPTYLTEFTNLYTGKIKMGRRDSNGMLLIAFSTTRTSSDDWYNVHCRDNHKGLQTVNTPNILIKQNAAC